jgi:Transcription factor Iwr1
LHITGTGNVELVFEYDSDWSDLADDEDPDSNDERFEGNDYPDEGAGEMS